MSKRTRLLAATVLAALVLSGCSVFAPDPRRDVAQLEVAWQIEGEVPLVTLDGSGSAEIASVTAGDRYFVTDHGKSRPTGVLAVDLTSGKTLWRAKTGLICSLSGPSDSGVLIAWQGAGVEGMGCETVVALDADTGETLWTHRTEHPARRTDATPLSVGVTDRTVTVPTTCGMQRLDAKTGKAISRIPDVPCDDEERPDTDEVTTGELIIVAEADALVAYDADSGDEVWSTPGTRMGIEAMRSRDPLVLDMTVDGVPGVREVDAGTGAIGAVIGRPLKPIHSGAFPLAMPSGGEIVGSYDHLIGGMDGTYASSLRAWDRDSGEETFAWSTPDDELIGVDDSGTYIGRTIDTDSSGGYAYWVMHRAPGGKMESVGWIDDQVLEFMKVGDLLLVHGWADPGDDSGLRGAITTAYRLPAKGVDVDPPTPKSTPAPVPWAKGDVRPDPSIDLCAEVTPATLRELGLGAAADAPAPLGCAWQGNGVYLAATASVFTPGKTDPVTGEEGENRSGSERAQAVVEATRTTGDFSDVADLGDVAIAQTSEAVGEPTNGALYSPPASSARVELVVRERNLVVAISVGTGEVPTFFTSSPQSSLPISGARLERIAIMAASDVVAAATGDPLVVPAADGPKGVPEVCTTVKVDGGEDSPSALGSGGDPRTSACLWQSDGEREGGGFVYAAAYEAGPGLLSGMSPAERAAALYRSSSGEPLRIDGADEAQIERSRNSWDGAARVVARTGDLVVIAQVRTDPADSSSDAAARAVAHSTAEAKRIAKELLAAR